MRRWAAQGPVLHPQLAMLQRCAQHALRLWKSAAESLCEIWWACAAAQVVFKVHACTCHHLVRRELFSNCFESVVLFSSMPCRHA